MKQVYFYYVGNTSKRKNLTPIEEKACQLAIKYWRLGKHILITCENKEQALKIDEELWIFDSKTFIPHNLSEESTEYGSSVEICWQQQNYNTHNKNLLINLLTICNNFFIIFDEIIDFIPDNQYFKHFARERYKKYLNSGFQFNIT